MPAPSARSFAGTSVARLAVSVALLASAAPCRAAEPAGDAEGRRPRRLRVVVSAGLDHGLTGAGEVVFPDGRRQVLRANGGLGLAIGALPGSVLWRSPWPGRTAVIPTPIVRDNQVYITTGYGVGSKLVKVGADNKAADVWENKVMKNHHGGVVLIGEHLYGYSDGPGWVCQSFKTGEEVWANKSLGKGAVVYAGGRLYCLDEGTGAVALAEASPEGWREHGRFKLEPQSKQRSNNGKIWMHPVVANGKLYLRDQEFLSCYDVAAGN